MKKIFLLLLIMMLLVGCRAQPKETPQAVPEPTEPAAEQSGEVNITPTPAAEVSNLFDARKAKVGDQVAGLKITKIEVHNASDEDYDASVEFEGEVTVSGTFKHNLNDEFLDHEISFKVDSESETLLPKLAHDQRYVWFMFMNHDEAEKVFGVPGTEGKAIVTIKNYAINYAHTDIWNTADLIKVEQ